MRRFSQRNPLVTLSDLNVTPLIDLAFVLLVIFMITTPLLEQGLSLDLPGDNESLSLEQIEQKLVADHQNNPNILVYIRADHRGTYGAVAAVLNRCEQNGITRVSLRTEPE